MSTEPQTRRARDDDDELALLHGQLVEDALDAAGRERLAALLADPERRRRFAALMRVDGALAEALCRREARVGPERPAVVVRLWPLAAAAGLAMAAGLAYLLTRPASEPPGTPAAEPAVVARWLSPSGRPPPRAGEAIVGPAVLELADGSRLDASGAARLVLDGPASVRQESGALRVTVEPRSAGSPLVVATPHTEVRVLGTEFAIAVETQASRIGVDAGTVQVRPHRGAPQTVAAGAALVVAADGTVAPGPPTAWAIALATHPAGWFGTPVPGGLAPAFDPEASATWKIDTWNVRMPTAGPLGIVGLDLGATLHARIRVGRETALAFNLQAWNHAGDRWLGSLQREAKLAAGTHDLAWPLASFRGVAGAAPEALAGMPLRKLALVAWDGQAGIVVETLAISR